MAGSGRPESKQVKKLGSDSSQMNHSYWSQQGDTPPPGSTTQHPNAVTTIVSDQQQNPVPDSAAS